jgi:enoyl-CoA hydratase/carnithine racemase
MSDPATIEVTTRDTLVVVTLNRPAKMNAMTLDMWRQTAEVFQKLACDRSARAILLTGAGGNFSVGADVSEFSAVRESRQQSIDYEIAVDAAADAIANVPQPVIAVLDGYCLGGGCHLVLPCDFRFAHPRARLGIPAAKLSIVYGLRSTQRLHGLVGLSQAKRLLYTATQVDAAEAHRIGLVDHVSDDAMAAAVAYAGAMAALAPLSIAGAKAILTGISIHGDADLKSMAQSAINTASDSADYLEGRAAFAEKRQPQFTGQ